MRLPPRSRSATDARRERADLHSFFDRYQASGGGMRFFMQSPLISVRAVIEALRLPVLRITTSGGVEGEMVRSGLTSVDAVVRTPVHAVVGVVPIPEEVSEFSDGSSMQTMRRKVRDARRRGITWEVVTDHGTRSALMQQADAHERTNAPEAYRSTVADNSQLVPHGLWLVARAADRTPLLLSVTPVDGTISVLRYFRTLATGNDASAARYLMTQVLVEQLHGLGVRHLVDTAPSIRLSSGLRHFQRMVGFRLVQLQLRPARDRPRAGGSRPRTGRPRPEVSRSTIEQYAATAGREELGVPS